MSRCTGCRAICKQMSTWLWLSKMAALSSLAVFCLCTRSIRSATGLVLTSSNANRATVRSATQERPQMASLCESCSLLLTYARGGYSKQQLKIKPK